MKIIETEQGLVEVHGVSRIGNFVIITGRLLHSETIISKSIRIP